MSSKVATKAAGKVVKAATKATPKAAPKTAAPAQKKQLAPKADAGFKDTVSRELVNTVFEGKVSLASANAAQTHIFTALRSNLAKTGRVAIPGLGVFKVGHRAARTGRNPKSGEALQIAARNSVRFSASPLFKTEVQAFKVPAKVPKAAKK